MARPVIQVSNLAKQYHIGLREKANRNFREALVDTATAPFRNLKTLARLTKVTDEGPDVIWALRNVSFDVAEGEALGIIGRNGAGKSTLLKILSRITEPTAGEVKLYGRVGSLLEVGTGFHSELTGRENIYLNGAILGMRKAEIDRKFDEIVAFSEIEKFLDTPVKRYSSGMYVRLAFAVAAHLEPEILLVDEVLAVGDAAFQKKCLGKMGDVAKGGRTILFVSHNTSAIQALCTRCLWIDKGGIRMDGQTHRVVTEYLNQGHVTTCHHAWPRDEAPGNRSMRILSVTLRDSTGEPCSSVGISRPISVEIIYEVIEKGTRATFSLHLLDENDVHVFSSLSNTADNKLHDIPLEPGLYRSACTIPGNLLNNGRYTVSLKGLSGWRDSFMVERVLTIEAIDDGLLKRDYAGSLGGVVRPQLSWESHRLDRVGETPL